MKMKTFWPGGALPSFTTVIDQINMGVKLKKGPSGEKETPPPPPSPQVIRRDCVPNGPKIENDSSLNLAHTQMWTMF